MLPEIITIENFCDVSDILMLETMNKNIVWSVENQTKSKINPNLLIVTKTAQFENHAIKLEKLWKIDTNKLDVISLKVDKVEHCCLSPESNEWQKLVKLWSIT